MSADGLFPAFVVAEFDGSEGPTEAPSTASSDSEDIADFVVRWERRRGSLASQQKRNRAPPKRLRCIPVFEDVDPKRKRIESRVRSDEEVAPIRGGGPARFISYPSIADTDDEADVEMEESPRGVKGGKKFESRKTAVPCCDMAPVDECAARIALRCSCGPASNLVHGSECPVCAYLDLSDVPMLV
ncbi:hypothetical protein BESB_076690 [Besnoitia besnoiti]|uniref:Uncharacterized protein n=1 Tax=Besnoitia besnoiti TaxID=94643 RepID=A0A2A9MDK3_BESBE|nr:hypothetical protein BESB_076690 [Besnoitia besnoiti]PFH33452.1 hypothetical protein BESB_076690 [Besnoitia besnoiti]